MRLGTRRVKSTGRQRTNDRLCRRLVSGVGIPRGKVASYEESRMTLDDIAADVTLVLTREYNRLFKAAGCQPTCHACLRQIRVGMKFKLATHERRDVMLCAKHSLKHLTDPAEVEKVREARWRRQAQERLRAGLSPGFSRPSLHETKFLTRDASDD